MHRESLLTRTFADLADNLVDDFDVVELLTLLTHGCIETLDVAAAGIMLVGPDGQLRVMASSSEAIRLLELFELQSHGGPCHECQRTAQPVVNQLLETGDVRWPRFATEALAAGFRSVHALPMRMRGTVIGVLNLFRTAAGDMRQDEVEAAQSLANVATIVVLQQRAIRDHQAVDNEIVNDQLRHALDSRVVIEQAKGILAERSGLDVDQAFAALRSHARHHNLRLVDLAHDLIAGTLAAGSIQPAIVPPAGGPLPVNAFATLATLAEIEPVLDLVEAVAPVEVVGVVASELASLLGAEQVSFLIADLGGDSVIRFVRPDGQGPQAAGSAERLEKVALAGTPYQRALLTQEVQLVAEGSQYRLFAPVADRGDALGVLELVLGRRPDDALIAKVASAAHALAYVVIANRRHTDLFESVQRNAPFSLAAEIQRRLLPSASTCEAEQFTFAGWLEPASHVGGDTFDYSIDRDVLHVSMTDAMGHGVKAALMATLVLGSLRNGRRGGVGLAEQAQQANEAMVSHAREDQFVTGLLLRADLRSGRFLAVNAGHPQPYHVRGGRVRRLALDADMPFGIATGSSYREQVVQLEAGDRFVVVTDGLLERTEAVGHLDVAAALADTATLHPREVVHVFKASVLAATEAELHDDASVLCIDWHGHGPPSRRGRSLGSRQRRTASAADAAG